jgi:ribosomal protein S18 acetylase RimI-like enzyme
MDLQIRRADKRDAATVALIGRVTFRETFGHLFENHAGDLRAYLDRTFNVAKIECSLLQARNSYWLALVDGLPVGYAKLKYPSPALRLGADLAAQLQKIYLLKEFAGQGIGDPLLETVLAHASMLNPECVWLDVLKQNERAIRFYQKRGFVAAGDDNYTIGAQTFLFHLMVLREKTKA